MPNSPQSNTRCSDRPVLPWLTATLLFWPVAIGGAALDLWSKWAVFRWLSQTQTQEYSVIDGFLRLILRVNDGAAFSLFRGWTFFLVAISVIALTIVIGVFFFGKLHSKLMLFALGCITGGIIGNLYDRAFNDGKVRDFIDVLIPVIDYPWPTFNVADSMLCIGVGLLIIANLRTQQPHITGIKE
ncbi:MAG: signal peptidase II [Planctomycetota bacterium]